MVQKACGGLSVDSGRLKLQDYVMSMFYIDNNNNHAASLLGGQSFSFGFIKVSLIPLMIKLSSCPSKNKMYSALDLASPPAR